ETSVSCSVVVPGTLVALAAVEPVPQRRASAAGSGTGRAGTFNDAPVAPQTHPYSAALGSAAVVPAGGSRSAGVQSGRGLECDQRWTPPTSLAVHQGAAGPARCQWPGGAVDDHHSDSRHGLVGTGPGSQRPAAARVRSGRRSGIHYALQDHLRAAADGDFRM
ncbi:Na(+) H(+) antiporter subunit E, partial [Pseudomonas sp. FG-3G]